ncbi:MAG: transposase, partial [Polaromonas sp.]|nr:transposase [Polaromonas sp.]
MTVQGAMSRDARFKQSLCADIDGICLLGAVRCAAQNRPALEQLCRAIVRPALAAERVQTSAARQVVLKLKTPLARRHHAPGVPDRKFGSSGLFVGGLQWSCASETSCPLRRSVGSSQAPTARRRGQLCTADGDA